MKEIWKIIPGYKGLYEVSNQGRVRSYSRGNNPRILKPEITWCGYARTALCRNGAFDRNHLSIHRLVAQAFIPNPENKPEINHKNGIKADNRVENLEWCTISENRKHAIATGLMIMPRGKQCSWAKLNEHKVQRIRLLIELGIRHKKIAKMFNISPSNVSHISVGSTWAHLPQRSFS